MRLTHLFEYHTWFMIFLSLKHGNTNDKNTSFNKFPQKYFLLAVLYLSVKGNQLTSTATNKKTKFSELHNFKFILQFNENIVHHVLTISRAKKFSNFTRNNFSDKYIKWTIPNFTMSKCFSICF
jgi:hypothetical protein